MIGRGPYGPAGEPITGTIAEGLRHQDRRCLIVYFDRYTQHRYGAVKSHDLSGGRIFQRRLTFRRAFGMVQYFMPGRGQGLRCCRARPEE